MKNIIFDLGGVLLNLDISRTERAFRDMLGAEEHARVSKELQEKQFFERFETGDIHEDDFLHTLGSYSEHRFSRDEIKRAWSAMLLDLPADRVDFLRSLRESGHKVFLFSNTNSLHLKDFSESIRLQHNGLVFDTLFDKAYYSHLVRHRKPHPTAFQVVCNDAGIDPANTIFIDDNHDNIAGAKTAGLIAIWHEPNSLLNKSSLGL